MKSYLILESPRVASLGYRILVSSGLEAGGRRLDDLLKRPGQKDLSADLLEVSYAVKQPGQSGITGRDGLERLVLVSPKLCTADQALRNRVRENMINLLQADAEMLLADPELSRTARDRTVIEHSLMDEWLGRVEDILEGHEPVSSTCTAAKSEPVPASTQRRTAAVSMMPSEPARSTSMKAISKNSVVMTAVVLIAGLLAVIFFAVQAPEWLSGCQRPPAHSFEGKYEWLPEDVGKPRNREEAQQFERCMDECWQELVSFIEKNDDYRTEWEKIDRSNFPVRAWYLELPREWLNSGNLPIAENLFSRVLSALSGFREAMRAAPDAGMSEMIPNHLSSSEFVKVISDPQNAEKIGALFAELHYPPSNFIAKAYGLFSWEKEGIFINE